MTILHGGSFMSCRSQPSVCCWASYLLLEPCQRYSDGALCCRPLPFMAAYCSSSSDEPSTGSVQGVKERFSEEAVRALRYPSGIAAEAAASSAARRAFESLRWSKRRLATGGRLAHGKRWPARSARCSPNAATQQQAVLTDADYVSCKTI